MTYHISSHVLYDGDVPIAEVGVRVYPQYDEAFPDALAADYEVENNITHKWHGASKEMAAAIAAQMKADRPEEWKEVLALAADNYCEQNLHRARAL